MKGYKGTKAMLIIAILQSIMSVFYLALGATLIIYTLINTAIVWVIFVGFRKENREWITFSLFYGIYITLTTFAMGNPFNFGLAITIVSVVSLSSR